MFTVLVRDLGAASAMLEQHGHQEWAQRLNDLAVRIGVGDLNAVSDLIAEFDGEDNLCRVYLRHGPRSRSFPATAEGDLPPQWTWGPNQVFAALRERIWRNATVARQTIRRSGQS